MLRLDLRGLALVAATVFASEAALFEGQQILDFGGDDDFSADGLHGGGEVELGLVEEFAGFVESQARLGRDAHAAEADGVDVVDSFVDAVDEHEGWDVPGDLAEAADHGDLSDPHVLMDADHAADGDEVFDRDMSGEAAAVGDGDLVAEGDVVPQVAVGHDEAVVADPRVASLTGGAVDGDVLAEDVVIADLEIGWFARVFPILRVSSQHSALGDHIVAAEGSVAADGDVAFQLGARTQDSAFVDHAEGTDDDVLGKLGARVHAC
jgi:hypothetical protein